MDFVGGVRKMVILLTFSTICADVGWVGQKKSKNVLMLLRNGP